MTDAGFERGNCSEYYRTYSAICIYPALCNGMEIENKLGALGALCVIDVFGHFIFLKVFRLHCPDRHVLAFSFENVARS